MSFNLCRSAATRLFGSLLATAALVACAEEPVVRVHQRLVADWKFTISDTAFAYEVDFDDSQWRTLNLPHDWAIEGDFAETNPSGVGGGALPGGMGWYRKNITMTDDDLCGRVLLTLDGVYMNATVFVNGIKEGKRPYGYSSVCYDITLDLKKGDNVIAVKVDNTDQPNSRWYSGCGIYRNVWLTKTNKVHVAPWGTFITTPLVNSKKADVKMTTSVVNNRPHDVDVDVCTTILNDSGRVVASDEGTLHIEAGKTQPLIHSMKILKPRVWDVDDPVLYTAHTVLRIDGVEVDQYNTTFGVRSAYFDDKNGFILNDRRLKMNGVCLHHDLGCLGAAVNTRAIERQLEMLKEMGCNAIRCTHNPPAPELLDLCDRMGFVVVDEAFDMWRRKKTERDYARFFDEWHERDLVDLIRRDRNHPSIVAWSIGNEVLEQWDQTETTSEDAQKANIDIAMGRGAKNSDSETLSDGALLCRHLAEIVHREDPTRPVTAGCNAVEPSNNLFKANALDLIGFNYHNQYFDSVPQNFKGKPFYVSESNSALMTRGYYKMPSNEMYIMPDDWRFTSNDPSLSCSSYDNCHVPWGSTHELTMTQVRDNDFIAGQFVWTGFDYIGEPTPYGWPARSSYFGIIDLAGIPKDVYYLYQSEWQHKKTVLHLFPHWNWDLGETVDLWCYFNNADEVELYVNGHSMGKRRKSPNCLHAYWRVEFEPGEIYVVSRRDGKTVAETKTKTAGRPAAIRLTPDRSRIHANGDDLSFVTVEIVDADGNLCPTAQNDVHFTVEGCAAIEGVDNGSPFSLERFKDNHRKAFYGKCMVVIRSNGITGNARLRASSEGLADADVTINCLDDSTY
ncbi:MAG: DUF4982 domain-containing protein [Bacteroidales bacterium]|nr:DUF4982 domain-containing protein [Bacteroidales bacterium]